MTGIRIRIRFSICCIAAAFFLFWTVAQAKICLCQSLDEQSSEAFYIKLLSQGEQSFLSADYRKALKELEIAAFGLFRQNELIGKAYILMSLSYSHLEEADNAVSSLKEAFRWINEEDFRALELNISGSDRELLERLIEKEGVLVEAPEAEQAAPIKFEKEVPVPPLEIKKLVAVKKETSTDLVKKTPEKKPPTGSVDERIAQLLAERKQQSGTVKKKDTAELSRETEQKVDQDVKEKEDQIRGLEPLFETEEAPEDFFLTEIWIKKEDNSMQVDLLFRPYTSHHLFEITNPLPQRIVIDIHNISGIKAGQKIVINDFGIASIRTGMFEAKTARIVFDAVGDLPLYSVEKTEGGLKVIISKPVD